MPLIKTVRFIKNEIKKLMKIYDDIIYNKKRILFYILDREAF